MNNNPIDELHKTIALRDIATNNREIADLLYNSKAETIARYLYDEIIRYQQSLPDSEDVVMMIVQFNDRFMLRVEQIGYAGCNLVMFLGTDMSGKPLKLIQHISQLNFLLQVEPKKIPDAPKRQIGFCVDP